MTEPPPTPVSTFKHRIRREGRRHGRRAIHRQRACSVRSNARPAPPQRMLRSPEVQPSGSRRSPSRTTPCSRSRTGSRRGARDRSRTIPKQGNGQLRRGILIDLPRVRLRPPLTGELVVEDGVDALAVHVHVGGADIVSARKTPQHRRVRRRAGGGPVVRRCRICPRTSEVTVPSGPPRVRAAGRPVRDLSRVPSGMW